MSFTMQALNLPPARLKMVRRAGKREVFDVFRKRYVALTPEEWVRQHFLHWLVAHKDYPVSLIAVESHLMYNQMPRRADAIVYDRHGKPLMIIECKAASVTLNRDVFDQVARYNAPFGVPFLVASNGLTHYCCLHDRKAEKWLFLEDVPAYAELLSRRAAMPGL